MAKVKQDKARAGRRPPSHGTSRGEARTTSRTPSGTPRARGAKAGPKAEEAPPTTRGRGKARSKVVAGPRSVTKAPVAVAVARRGKGATRVEVVERVAPRKPSSGRPAREETGRRATAAGRKPSRVTRTAKTPVAKPSSARALRGKSPKGAAKKAGSSRSWHLERPVPERVVRVRELDPFARCGPRTSVVHLYRVDERVDGESSVHLVFNDRHGWYCEHGKACPAVDDVRRHGKQFGLTF